MKVDDPMLDMKQLGAVLNVDAEKAQRLCTRGRIPAKHVGLGSKRKQWRVKLSIAIKFRDTPDNEPISSAPNDDGLPPYIRRMAG